MYDCIVIGIGGIGSAALYEAVKRGWKVLGIDRFGVAHARGSSHGQTRIIRAAYYEHPNYVPLVQRAFEYWDDLQRSCRQNLITRTGLIQVGNPEGELIQGILASANAHKLDVESWSTSEAMQRYPIFNLQSGHVAIFEKGAGLLRVERCVAHYINLATELGAGICVDDAVARWIPNDDGTFDVLTAAGNTFRSGRLIVAAGSWTEDVLGVPFRFKILRKQQHWFQLDRIDQRLENGLPCFLMETDSGCFYGFPVIDHLGMKIAEHSGGEIINDPTNVDRQIDDSDQKKAEEFLDSHFHFARRQLVHHSVCLYTKSVDEHFVIDRHPAHPQLVFAGGLSGHGFKFAPVIGRHLVELLEGREDPLFDFFRIGSRH